MPCAIRDTLKTYAYDRARWFLAQARDWLVAGRPDRACAAIQRACAWRDLARKAGRK